MLDTTLNNLILNNFKLHQITSGLEQIYKKTWIGMATELLHK